MSERCRSPLTLSRRDTRNYDSVVKRVTISMCTIYGLGQRKWKFCRSCVRRDSLLDLFPSFETAPDPTRKTSRWPCLSCSFEREVSSKRKSSIVPKKKIYTYLAEELRKILGENPTCLVRLLFPTSAVSPLCVYFFSPFPKPGFIELPGVTRYLNIYIYIYPNWNERDGRVEGTPALPICRIVFSTGFHLVPSVYAPIYRRNWTLATIRSSFSVALFDGIVKLLNPAPLLTSFSRSGRSVESSTNNNFHFASTLVAASLRT